MDKKQKQIHHEEHRGHEGEDMGPCGQTAKTVLTSRVEEEMRMHLLPPSSNRTCGFPASGFPLDFTKEHTQGENV